MHKIRLLVGRVAQVAGIIVSQRKGSLIDVSLREAYRMIDAGQAEAEGDLPPRPEPEPELTHIELTSGSEDDEDGPAINESQPIRRSSGGSGEAQALDLPGKIIDALTEAELVTVEQIKAALADGSINDVDGIGKMAVKQITLAIQRHEISGT